ncbi:MAG: hypothetical protein FJ358_06840 [Thaumarchaeota archaeon]|nr:hypothetical protein [Nitrososphaerota archaeon]
MSKEEQRRQKKKERIERRRQEIEARARSKGRRKVLTIFVIAAILAGFGYAVYVAVTNSPSIGPLNSAHYHADWALYINGAPVTINQTKWQLKSEYVHMEGGISTIHMHAVNVPLEYFFNSLGMRLTETSLTFDGTTYNNEGDKKVRTFVNGKEVSDLTKYVPKSMDKILIVYGNETDAKIQEYIKTVPDLAKSFDQPPQAPAAGR